MRNLKYYSTLPGESTPSQDYPVTPHSYALYHLCSPLMCYMSPDLKGRSYRGPAIQSFIFTFRNGDDVQLKSAEHVSLILIEETY